MVDRRAALALLALGVLVLAAAGAAGDARDEHLTADVEPFGDAGTMGQSYECGGQAPIVPVCTTGVHVRQGNSFALGVEARNFTGVLENRIEWAFGSIVLRCHVDGAEIECTSHEDGFPAAGTPVLHECRSWDPGGQQPGGSGTWWCSFVD